MCKHQRLEEGGDKEEGYSVRRKRREIHHLRRSEFGQHCTKRGRHWTAEHVTVIGWPCRRRKPWICGQEIRDVFEGGSRRCLATLPFRARVTTALQSVRERWRRRVRTALRLLARCRGRRRQQELPAKGAFVHQHTRLFELPPPTNARYESCG